MDWNLEVWGSIPSHANEYTNGASKQYSKQYTCVRGGENLDGDSKINLWSRTTQSRKDANIRMKYQVLWKVKSSVGPRW